MESIHFSKAIQIFHEKRISLFDLSSARKIFRVENPNTLYKLLERLEQKKAILRLKPGKFIFAFAQAHEFEIANFLLTPSYISLESALSFYGILSQFPHSITSVTTRKTRKYQALGKLYEYSHFNAPYFFGYVRQDKFLIAEPEKALLDLLYLASKGLVKVHLNELELSNATINRKKFWDYARKMEHQLLRKFLEANKKYL